MPDTTEHRQYNYAGYLGHFTDIKEVADRCLEKCKQCEGAVVLNPADVEQLAVAVLTLIKMYAESSALPDPADFLASKP